MRELQIGLRTYCSVSASSKLPFRKDEIMENVLYFLKFKLLHFYWWDLLNPQLSSQARFLNLFLFSLFSLLSQEVMLPALRVDPAYFIYFGKEMHNFLVQHLYWLNTCHPFLVHEALLKCINSCNVTILDSFCRIVRFCRGVLSNCNPFSHCGR